MKKIITIEVTYHELPENVHTEKYGGNLENSGAGFSVFKPSSDSSLPCVYQQGVKIIPEAQGFKDQYFAYSVQSLVDMINDISEIDALGQSALDNKMAEILQKFKKIFFAKKVYNDDFNDALWENTILKLLSLRLGESNEFKKIFRVPHVGLLKLTAQSATLENEIKSQLKP